MSCKSCTGVAASGYYDNSVVTYRDGGVNPILVPNGTGGFCNGKKVGCPPLFGCGDRCVKDCCTGVTKCPLPYVVRKPKKAVKYVTVECKTKEDDPCAPVEQPCQRKRCCLPERRTRCYTLPPKRLDGYPQDPRPYDLAYLDGFDTFKVGQKDKCKWKYFTNDKDFIANDGSHKITKNGLTINASTFTKTYPDSAKEGHCHGDSIVQNGYLDHFKNFVILDSQFQVPLCGQVYAEACMSAVMKGVQRAAECFPEGFGSQVTDPQSDLRLAYGGFSMLDWDTGILLGFALTNSAIYALYEVLPFDNDDGCGNPKATFAAAYWVGGRNKRDPLCDFVRLGLAIDRRKGGLWYLNDNLVHQVVRLGTTPDPEDTLYLTPGNAEENQPTCVQIGFGLFSMMDAFSANADSIVGKHEDERQIGLIRLSTQHYQSPLRPLKKAVFVYNDRNPEDRRLFGQGGVIQVKEVKVENRF